MRGTGNSTDLAEDGDDEDAGREDDRRRHDADEELREREGDGADVDGGRLHLFVRLEEHAVGDHGEEEQRGAARDTLHAREVAPGGAREHGEPHVVVAQLLADRRVEEVLEGRQVSQAGHGQDALHHSVILLHRQPTVAQKEEPAHGIYIYIMYTDWLKVFHTYPWQWLKVFHTYPWQIGSL